MSQGIKTLQGAGGVNGGAQQLLPDRGKGVKRQVLIHVYNAANVTAFISHEPTLLREPLTQVDTNFVQQAGFPIGKNGLTSPAQLLDWEGPMWGVGSADGVQIFIEEANG